MKQKCFCFFLKFQVFSPHSHNYILFSEKEQKYLFLYFFCLESDVKEWNEEFISIFHCLNVKKLIFSLWKYKKKSHKEYEMKNGKVWRENTFFAFYPHFSTFFFPAEKFMYYFLELERMIKVKMWEYFFSSGIFSFIFLSFPQFFRSTNKSLQVIISFFLVCLMHNITHLFTCEFSL